MIIGDLKITDEVFAKHLDRLIDEKTVDKALMNSGLLPFKTTFKITPNITSSKKEKYSFNTDEVYETIDKIIFRESSSQNFVDYTFKAKERKNKKINFKNNRKIQYAA